MVLKIAIDGESEEFVPVWTNAPTVFDFDSIEVATDVLVPDSCPVASRLKNEAVSRIALVPKSLLDAQIARNRSGLYVTHILSLDEVRDYMIRTFLWSRIYGRKA